MTSGDTCTEICGDGLNMGGQLECDDGDRIDGDGCSKDCKIEKGWTCLRNSGTPDICFEICGDGVNLGGVQCDDGNREQGDGCD